MAGGAERYTSCASFPNATASLDLAGGRGYAGGVTRDPTPSPLTWALALDFLALLDGVVTRTSVLWGPTAFEHTRDIRKVLFAQTYQAARKLYATTSASPARPLGTDGVAALSRPRLRACRARRPGRAPRPTRNVPGPRAQHPRDMRLHARGAGRRRRAGVPRVARATEPGSLRRLPAGRQQRARRDGTQPGSGSHSPIARESSRPRARRAPCASGSERVESGRAPHAGEPTPRRR